MSESKYTNIHEAKTHLSRLIQRVLDGEEVIIAKAGKPLVKIVAWEEPKLPPRKFGQWEGKVWLADDFYDCDAEIEEMFYASRIFPEEAEENGAQEESESP